jgi:hypothetical protein
MNYGIHHQPTLSFNFYRRVRTTTTVCPREKSFVKILSNSVWLVLFILGTFSLAPRRQRGSPFSNKQAPDLSQGKYNQHANSQRQNKHNPQNDTKHLKHIQHDIWQASPIGDELDPQILNPIGDEEQKQITLDDHDSEMNGNPFNDTDARKL